MGLRGGAKPGLAFRRQPSQRKSVSTGTSITLWIICAVIAAGVAWSRYEKKKTRDKLLRELTAMDPDRREKLLSRLSPKLQTELREDLMERFRMR